MSLPDVFPFEAILPEIDFLPIAARRALGHSGLRLTRDGWKSLGPSQRIQIVSLGASEKVLFDQVKSAAQQAFPMPDRMDATSDPLQNVIPLDLLRGYPFITLPVWNNWRSLDRFAMVYLLQRSKELGDPTILDVAYEFLSRKGESVPPISIQPTSSSQISTHINTQGRAQMVNVGDKAPTKRKAVATASVRMHRETLNRLVKHDTPKGEVLSVSRVAGIMAAKKTNELIPLCHSVALTNIEVLFDLDVSSSKVNVTAVAEAFDRTGVEMEAIVAASVASITIYDMLKGIDREMTIIEVQLLEKSGGKSGDYRRKS